MKLINLKKVDDSLASDLQGELKKKFPNVDIFIGGTREYLVLSRIVVPKDEREKGLGTKVMNELIKMANKYKKIIALTPSKDFGGSVSRLKQFYKNLGFTENKGKNKDYQTTETMYKLPDSDVTTSEVIQTTYTAGKDIRPNKKKKIKAKRLQK